MVQVFFISVFTIVGQFFYAKAFSIAPGDKVNTWIYMSLVFASIIGYFMWDEPILDSRSLGQSSSLADRTWTRENGRNETQPE